MSKQVALGVIGLGHIADSQLRALAALRGEFGLVAAADLESSQASKLPSGTHFYTHYQQLLLDSDVDAVLICTPVSTHATIAAAALAAGKHVLLEKPATPDPEGYSLLKDRAASATSTLVIAFHAAFALDLLAYITDHASAYGPPSVITCGFYDPYVADPQRFESLGGSWLDSGVNAALTPIS